MKICFFLQRRFAYVGYALAEHLYKKYGVQKFSGLVLVRRSYNFIKDQTSPRFSGLLLTEDVHRRYKTETIDWEFIKNLENDYGLPNLWPYIELDRIVRSNQLVRSYPYDTPPYSHEEMIKIIQVNAKAIINFLNEEKPDAIVFSVVGSIGSLLLYEIAKKRNIKTLIIHSARIGIKYILSEHYLNFSYVDDLYKKLQAGEISLPEGRAAAIASLDKFRESPETYGLAGLPKFQSINQRGQFNFLSPKRLRRSLCWQAKMITRYLRDPYRDDYSTINPFMALWDNLKKKIRILIGYNDLYDGIDPKEDFAFFPLHYEPEISTLLYAPFYKDQLWLVKQIARSLPLNFKLYLKEHPAMVGFRTRGFYRELKKIPNLKLINPSSENWPLIKGARLVATISGTAGWEAVRLNKPVITFSDVFYSRLPMVKRCAAIEQLPCLVKEQLENFKADENTLINLLTAINHESVEVDLSRIWEVEAGQTKAGKDQLLPLANLIAKKLSLNFKIKS